MNTSNSPQPEWVDTKEVKRIFFLGKTTLYNLAATNQIKSASLREPGKQRGKRLFSCESIRALLEAQAAAR